MKVGTFAYATEQGLGYLARDFIRHNVVTDVLVVRHGRRPDLKEWYPEADWFSESAAREFVKQMDVMLFFETPFDWSIIPYCRKHGVKTFLMPMYECTPERLPYVPDYYLCPSQLDLNYFPDNSEFIPVPVDTAEFPWRERTIARTFVHNAGHGGLRGRNGTQELLKAIPLVKSDDVQFVIRHQDKLPPYVHDSRLRAEQGSIAREHLYIEGDVFLFPEKFNGLSLPIQEAYASGMLQMVTRRFPMTTWLPVAPMIPMSGTRTNRIGPPYLPFEEAILSPKVIAETIDTWAGKPVSTYSQMGKVWAEEHSWEALAPRYREVLSK